MKCRRMCDQQEWRYIEDMLEKMFDDLRENNLVLLGFRGIVSLFAYEVMFELVVKQMTNVCRVNMKRKRLVHRKDKVLGESSRGNNNWLQDLDYSNTYQFGPFKL